MKVQIYDTTLRDGTRSETVAFSVEDKLRVARRLDDGHGTASKVRVLIQQTDGDESWTTVGVSENILEAS